MTIPAILALADLPPNLPGDRQFRIRLAGIRPYSLEPKEIMTIETVL